MSDDMIGLLDKLSDVKLTLTGVGQIMDLLIDAQTGKAFNDQGPFFYVLAEQISQCLNKVNEVSANIEEEMQNYKASVEEELRILKLKVPPVEVNLID